MNLTPVVLTIHTILVLALVGVVLLQRSEGGALGIGGGGGGGGLMSGRGAANVLTRSTTVLAACFFSTSLLLALMADRGVTQEDVVRSITGEESSEQGAPGDLGEDDIRDILGDIQSPSVAPEASIVMPPVPETGDDPASDDEGTNSEPETPNGN